MLLAHEKFDKATPTQQLRKTVHQCCWLRRQIWTSLHFDSIR